MRRLDRSGVLWAGGPDPAAIDRVLAEQAAAAVTYAGAEPAGASPEGFNGGDRTRVIGRGGPTFTAAAETLRGWGVHRGAGLRVHPPRPSLTVGTDLAVLAALGPVTGLACCRVVRVVDRPTRFGFAYATLPAHPEVGEELFLVEQHDEVVTFTISVLWRPRHLLARVGHPLARILQGHATTRYLDAMTRQARST